MPQFLIHNTYPIEHLEPPGLHSHKIHVCGVHLALLRKLLASEYSLLLLSEKRVAAARLVLEDADTKLPSRNQLY